MSELGAELKRVLSSVKPTEGARVPSKPHPQHPRGNSEARAQRPSDEDLQCVLRKGVAFGSADSVRDVLSA